MTECVRLDFEDDVATVTLDHPDVRNALTSEVATGIMDAMAEVEKSEARCVVVTGAGGYFCAGGDVQAMLEGVEDDAPAHERVERIVEETAGAVEAVAACDLPTVAKLDGAAYGAGATLAIACDLLLASTDAKISFGFRQVGLSIDSGASYLLPRLVGENVAKELVYTGELIDAQRASDIGLFNRVYPAESFDSEANSLVERVASGPTVALQNSKRLLEQGFDSTFEQAIRNEAAMQAISGGTHDHVEGVQAFAEHRDPDFDGK